MNEQTRAYIYRIALAVVVLATAYGLIADQGQIAAITAVISAVLGNGLATVNTDRNPD